MNHELLMLLDVTIAAFLAGIVGIERELQGKPAGFRTHMIIGGAAATLVLLGQELVDQYSEESYFNLLRVDPLRVIEAIVVGISFIGAGTILKQGEKKNIAFLTTAASVLFSAAIGISIALHAYIFGIGLSILIFIINFVLQKFENFLLYRDKKKNEKRKEKNEDS